MGLLLSLFFGFVPVFFFSWFIYWIDRYEKEPLKLLGLVFFWGAVIAAAGAWLINTVLGVGVYLFTGSETAANITTGSLIAPVVEESLKGLAVLIIFLRYRYEFDSILDGIIYAAITGLGFAAIENTFYIYNFGYLENGLEGLFTLAFVRVVLVGWQHAFYTAFIGIGLGVARLHRNMLIKILAPVVGWSMAIFAHSFHNTMADLLPAPFNLIGILIDWSGWLLILLVILWTLYQERLNLIRYLNDEVKADTISHVQYRVACSAWAVSMARLSSMFSGRYHNTSTFYRLCGELAHKRNQVARLGDEGENNATIQRIRQELARLSPLI
jgi:RsiW-degrading membrane proteinase PrsW (M82 family)